MDSMWATGPILFRSDPTGRIIEAWREMTNRDGEYCGRDIVWLDYWRKVMPKPMRPHDVVNAAAKQGVGMARFRISREAGAEIKRIEREQGHDAALRLVLGLLRRSKDS
jgi:hypothetical protein